jgi:hypothetical protein
MQNPVIPVRTFEKLQEACGTLWQAYPRYADEAIPMEDHWVVVDELVNLAMEALWIAPELQEHLLQIHLRTLAEQCVPPVAQWNDEQPLDGDDWDDDDEDEESEKPGVLEPTDIRDDEQLMQAMRIEWTTRRAVAARGFA